MGKRALPSFPFHTDRWNRMELPFPLKHKRALPQESVSLEIKDQNCEMRSIWLFSPRFEHSNDYTLTFSRQFWEIMSLMEIREDEGSGKRAGNTKFCTDHFERMGKGRRRSDFSFSTPFVRNRAFWQQNELSWEFYTGSWKNGSPSRVEQTISDRMASSAFL